MIYILKMKIIISKIKTDFEKITQLFKISFLFNIDEKIKANKDNIRPRAFSDILEKLKGQAHENVTSALR